MLATLEARAADVAHRRPVRASSPASRGHDLLRLQRAAGNRAVSAMLGHGSTAVESEEENGPVGRHGPRGNGGDGGATTTGGDAGTPTPTPSPTPTPTPTPTPPPLTLTSATAKAAPSGAAATRTDIGADGQGLREMPVRFAARTAPATGALRMTRLPRYGRAKTWCPAALARDSVHRYGIGLGPRSVGPSR
jgi:hypothetical protein